MYCAQRAINAFFTVDGIVDFPDVGRQLSLQFTHPCRGRGGNHDLQIRHTRLQRADELRANVDFADAHRVHPQDVTVCQGLLELCVVAAETLTETLSPVASPPHLQKVVGCGEGEKDRKQDVVKGAHCLATTCVYLSQKSAGLPRKIRDPAVSGGKRSTRRPATSASCRGA